MWSVETGAVDQVKNIWPNFHEYGRKGSAIVDFENLFILFSSPFLTEPLLKNSWN